MAENGVRCVLVNQSKMERERERTFLCSKYQDRVHLALGMTGFRNLNAIWLVFITIILSYSLFPPLFLSISQLSLSLNVGFSPAIDRLSSYTKEYVTDHLNITA